MGMIAKRENFLAENPSSSKSPLAKASRVSELFLYFPHFPFQNDSFLLENVFSKGILFTIFICTIGYFSSASYIVVYHWVKEGNNFPWNSSSFQDLVQIQSSGGFSKTLISNVVLVANHQNYGKRVRNPCTNQPYYSIHYCCSEQIVQWLQFILCLG